ncbi:hypothetical protein ACFL6Y_09645, partial [Elusimicrobiota bacterium]
MGQIWAGVFKSIEPDTIPWLFVDKPAYGNGCCNTAYKRLAKLESGGYLKRKSERSSPLIFMLTSKGYWQLSKKGLNRFSKAPADWPRDPELRHTLIVAACGLVIEQAFGSKVKAEREIISDFWVENKKKLFPSGQPSMPDLIAHHGGRKIRVEVELSLKNNKRYIDYWDSLGAPMCGQRPHILYIAGTPQIKNHLLSIAKKDYWPGMFICDLNAFKSTVGKA